MPINEENAALKKKKFINIFHSPVIAWVVLVASIMLTIAAYKISNNFVNQRAKDRFEFRANEIEKAIEERLQVYEDLLWGGVGMMYTHDSVTRQQFAKFVETMDIEKHWPGIQGFGFSVPVKTDEKQAHIDAIRAEGFSDFTIRPKGERDMYSSIIYLEPFDWRNKRAFGYDMWSNDMRQKAMTRARDQGVAATSGIITLVQETQKDVQKGFLTYVPVYNTQNIPKTVEQRQNQFMGWVYAPYRAGNLMKGIIGTEDPNIEFEVFDGESMNTESLLFDSSDTNHLDQVGYQPDFSKIVKITNQGRVWTLYFSTPASYLSGGEKNQPRFIAIAGLIVDILLFYVIYSLYFINRRAEEIALEMTKEGNASKELLEESLKKAQEKADELETINRHMVDREIRMGELKKVNEKLHKKLGGEA